MFKSKYLLAAAVIGLTLAHGLSKNITSSNTTSVTKTTQVVELNQLADRTNVKSSNAVSKITAFSISGDYDSNLELVSYAKLLLNTKAQLPDITQYRLVWEIGLS